MQPGETVAIVGPSGGGKSTLCQLIPRFYDVSSGSICIDGMDVRQVKQRSIHQNIGIVQQDVFLFADTIFENIRYGKPDATEEEVYEAARKAEIYDDILAMPDGFDTYVGERGTLLSGVEKAAEEYGVQFYYQDFRPMFRDGQARARELGFYMQKYCGCVFSEQERYQKPSRIIP